MDIIVDSGKKIDESKLFKIRRLRDRAIRLHEKQLDMPYGDIPKIFIFDKDTFIRDYYITHTNLHKWSRNWKPKFKDIAENFLINFSGGSRYYDSVGAVYSEMDHRVILKEDNLGYKLTYTLSHELAHGQEESRKRIISLAKERGNRHEVGYILIEGIATYLAINIAPDILPTINKSRQQLHQEYEKKARNTLPMDYKGIRYMNEQTKPYHLGYLYISRKISEGMPLREIFSLYDNMPKTLRELHYHATP